METDQGRETDWWFPVLWGRLSGFSVIGSVSVLHFAILMRVHPIRFPPLVGSIVRFSILTFTRVATRRELVLLVLGHESEGVRAD